MLAQLRENFLTELPSRCETIGNLVIEFGKTAGDERFEELYRHVHSLKGSAGTHGLHFLATLFHHLEDHLNALEQGAPTRHFVDACLAWLDLAAESARALREEQPLEPFEARLEALRAGLGGQRLGVMLVCSSSYLALLCQQSLEALPVRITRVDNGLEALQRLLHPGFDLLITEKELSQLNGVALTLALRASDSAARDLDIVMLTSSHRLHFPEGMGPDAILAKDTHLQRRLVEHVSARVEEAAPARHVAT